MAVGYLTGASNSRNCASKVQTLGDGAEVADGGKKWNNENSKQTFRTDMVEWLALNDYLIPFKLSKINSFHIKQQPLCSSIYLSCIKIINLMQKTLKTN